MIRYKTHLRLYSVSSYFVTNFGHVCVTFSVQYDGFVINYLVYEKTLADT